jgi:hypothetical protein
MTIGSLTSLHTDAGDERLRGGVPQVWALGPTIQPYSDRRPSDEDQTGEDALAAARGTSSPESSLSPYPRKAN